MAYDEFSIGAESRQPTIPEFLNHLFDGVPPGMYFEVTLILPPELSDVGPSPITFSYKMGHTRPDWDRIQAMNERGYGVYYGLTAKKRKTRTRANEKDAAWCSVLWVDIDLDAGTYTSKEDAYRAICDLIQPATVIIDSGGGLHALWRIRPVPVNNATRPRIKAILRGLAVHLRGDTSVAELARVFRLPGTVNTKPQRVGAMCEVIDWLPGELTLDQFDEYAIAIRPTPAPRIMPTHAPDDMPGYVRWYNNQPHQIGERNNALNWTAYKMHSDGYSQAQAEAMLLPRALADGLDERDVMRTIRSAFTAPRGEPSYINPRLRTRMIAGDALTPREDDEK